MSLISRILPLGFLLAFVPACVKAQVYSLDSCVVLALENNKEIKAAQHQANKYAYNRQALHANYFPNISLHLVDLYSTVNASSTVNIASSIGQYTGEQLHESLPYVVSEAMQERITRYLTKQLGQLNPEVDFKVKNLFNASVVVEQPLYMGGKISAADRMGAIGEKMAVLGEQLSREEIIVAVYEGYQLLSRAKEMAVVAHLYDSLLTKLSHDVESAMKHGMASRNDVMKVMVKKNDAELKIRQAENGIRLARMNLCQMIGLPLHTPIDTEDGDAEELNVVIEKDVSLESRTEYLLLELKTSLAEQKVRLEVAEYRPQIAFLLQGGLLDGMEILNEKMFKHQPYLNVGAVVKVPLFHASEGSNKIRAAKEELRQERMNQENYTEKMNLEIQQEANHVDEALLELSLRKRNLEQCAENLRISRKTYDVGMESLSDLLTAQLLWQQAYADVVDSKFQVKINMMKWRKAAGRIYQSSLFQAQ